MNTAQPKPVTAFKVLVVDDQQPMRQIIRESLYRLGIRTVIQAGNAAEAMKAMRAEKIDLVLSDYNLGEATDGQQLLEAARGERILSPVAPWIFITANSLKGDILAAGDFIPDGYIVKPFTDELLSRYIQALSARKGALAPLLAAVDAQQWDEVLKIADGYIQRGDALSVEGLKQKARALMKLGRFEDARGVYGQALQMNSELGWANLGQAQALRALGQTELARSALERQTSEQPEYAAAFDALLDLVEEQGDQDAALGVAQALADLAPNARRKIKLGSVALGAGQTELAVKALESAVAKNRNSVTRTPHESVLLAQALLDSGEAGKALAVATEVGRRFAEDGAARLLAQALSAQAHQRTGNEAEAGKLMTEVERGLADTELGDEHKLVVAKSALATGRLDLGQNLIEAVARNNTDRPLMVASAVRAARGTPVEAACQALAEQASAHVTQALQELLQAKRSGDFAQALAIGERALTAAPANFALRIELCTLYLVAMSRLGQAAEHAARARELLGRLEASHPNHSRVAAARKFFRERVAAGTQGVPA